MDAKHRYGRIIVNLLLAIAVILLLIFVVPRLIVFFMPFVIGWVIAMIANPLVRFLEKHVKIRRKQGSALIIIAVIAAVCAILYFVITALVREIIALIENAPELFLNIQAQLSLLGDRLYGIYAKLPVDIQNIVDSFAEGFSSSAEGFLDKIEMPSLGGASNMAKGVAEGLLTVIISLLSAYFFVAEREELTKKFHHLLPKEWYERYLLVKNNFARALGGYFKAQFKIMLVMVVVMFIGFEILQIDYSILLALIISMLDFLPVLGTGTVLWPWMVIELINGYYGRTVGLLVIYLVCQLLRQVLQPKILGDSIGMSPLTTLIFMYIGYKIGGVLGMIIGIPLGMVLINLYHAGVFDPVLNDIRTVVSDIDRYRKGE